MKKNKNVPLPGDLSKEEKIERMIRVNHAGEYGAKRIYEGQIAFSKDQKSKRIFQEMLNHEQQHLSFFEEKIAEKQLRPTFLQPIWHIAGYSLGAITSLFGHKAAMACTVAVEEVIDEHYKSQIEDLESYESLNEDERNLVSNIKKFRNEELDHRDIGIKSGAKELFGFQLLATSIKLGSKTAIWLSKRL